MGVKRRGYGSLAPSSGSSAASWRRCTASRLDGSAKPARSNWNWRPVWSSSDSRPAPVSPGPNGSRRPTMLHRYDSKDSSFQNVTLDCSDINSTYLMSCFYLEKLVSWLGTMALPLLQFHVMFVQKDLLCWNVKTHLGPLFGFPVDKTWRQTELCWPELRAKVLHPVCCSGSSCLLPLPPALNPVPLPAGKEVVLSEYWQVPSLIPCFSCCRRTWGNISECIFWHNAAVFPLFTTQRVALCNILQRFFLFCNHILMYLGLIKIVYTKSFYRLMTFRWIALYLALITCEQLFVLVHDCYIYYACNILIYWDLMCCC